MKINFNREEALACLIALEKERKPYKWQQQAITKITKKMGLTPHIRED